MRPQPCAYREQRRLLADKGHHLAQPTQVKLTDICAVNQHLQGTSLGVNRVILS